MRKNRLLLMFLMLAAVSLSVMAKGELPKKGMLFHYAPYPRGVDFENAGELLDDVKLLPMLQYDWECDSVWKAGRQRHSSDAPGIKLEHLYMVDADISFAKAGAKQTLYMCFVIDRGDDYDGPVAMVRRGEEPSKWYYPFRYDKRREVKIDGKAQPGDSAVCHAQLRLIHQRLGLTRVLVEMEKQDGKTTVYFADTALVFYNTQRTDAETEPDRMVLCPFSKGRMEELVFWNRHLTEAEKHDVMCSSEFADEYVLPVPQAIQTQYTDQMERDKTWRGSSWILGAICVCLAIISLVVRHKKNLPVPYTFNGSKVVILLTIAGSLVHGYNLVTLHGVDDATIWKLGIYAVVITLTYIIVSFAPDLYNDLAEESNFGFLARLGKLHGCLMLIIVVAVLWLLYVFGQVVYVILPFFTIYRFCRNMWITKEVIEDLNSNPVDYDDEN